MKWVSNDFVHFDRVVTPWLIRRFVDPEAEFILLPLANREEWPADAIPYAVPGVELSGYETKTTTFDRVRDVYELDDPGLRMMSQVINYGVFNNVFDQPYPADRAGRLGEGLMAAVEGIMLTSASDIETIERALPVLDAYYALFNAEHCMDQRIDASLPSGIGRAMWLTAFVSAVAARYRRDGAGYDGRSAVVQDEAFEATLAAMRGNLGKYRPPTAQ